MSDGSTAFARSTWAGLRGKTRVRAQILQAMALMTLTSAAQRWVPMRRWSGVLGEPAAVPATWGQNAGAVRSAAADGVEADVARAIRVGSNHLPWEPSCLAQACAGQYMLHRRGTPGVVVIGLRRSNESEPETHAWLMGRAGALTGGPAADGFTPVTVFEQSGGVRALDVPLMRRPST